MKLLASIDYEAWMESNPDLAEASRSFPVLNEYYLPDKVNEVAPVLKELTSVQEEVPDGYVQQKYPALVKHIASGDVANMRRLSAEMNLMQPAATSRAGFVVRFIAAVLS
jgi:hypothetical protein